MSKFTVNIAFILIFPLLKFERFVADLNRTQARYSGFLKLYRLIMDSRHNPLSYLPDNNTRHMVMQLLAWMWCIIFSMSVGSVIVFGVTAVIHSLLVAGVFVTASVFEIASRKPNTFN